MTSLVRSAMKHPPIAIIVAMAENRVIGCDGRLPWRLPADMSRFRGLTMGKPIVMGRRTHESIGHALDGRRNIVVSRRPDYRAPGCTVATSLEAAFEVASSAAEIAVVGGAGIYEQALPVAARIHLTLVHARVDGDVRFPRIDPAAWREVSRTERRADARNRYDLSFIELVTSRSRESEPPTGGESLPRTRPAQTLGPSWRPGCTSRRGAPHIPHTAIGALMTGWCR